MTAKNRAFFAFLTVALPIAVIASGSHGFGEGLPQVASSKKIGIRREISQVDLTKELAPPQLATSATPTTVKEPIKTAPVFRANSFVGAQPKVNLSSAFFLYFMCRAQPIR